MNSEAYINDRLDTQIDWYDKKSKHNKTLYYALRILETICALSIPFIMGYVSDMTPGLKFTAGFLGVVVGGISGALGLYQPQENWISYRTTCETLRHEKYLYLTASGPYDGGAPLPLLVERVEALISKENTAWSQTLVSQREAKDK